MKAGAAIVGGACQYLGLTWRAALKLACINGRKGPTGLETGPQLYQRRCTMSEQVENVLDPQLSRYVNIGQDLKDLLEQDVPGQRISVKVKFRSREGRSFVWPMMLTLWAVLERPMGILGSKEIHRGTCGTSTTHPALSGPGSPQLSD